MEKDPKVVQSFELCSVRAMNKEKKKEKISRDDDGERWRRRKEILIPFLGVC